VPSTSVDRIYVEVQANLLPTIRLLYAMLTAGVPAVVFPSSGGTIYGDTASDEAFTETTPPRPSCSYGLGKLLVEELLTFRARHGGPHHVILRIANVYGPTVHDHRRQGVVNAFLQRMSRDEPLQVWGDGAAVRDYVYAGDVVSAMGALLAHDVRDEIVNVGTGHGCSIAMLIETLAQVTGRTPSIERQPSAYTGVSRNVLDCSRLQALTGWRPRVDLAEGVRRTWAAMTQGSRP
jgi:UDP-glucose 4-epimerase